MDVRFCGMRELKETHVGNVEVNEEYRTEGRVDHCFKTRTINKKDQGAFSKVGVRGLHTPFSTIEDRKRSTSERTPLCSQPCRKRPSHHLKWRRGRGGGGNNRLITKFNTSTT